MKKIITIVLILVSLSAGAQKIRFTDKTNKWNTATVNTEGEVGTNTYVYDTGAVFLHGNSYQTLTSVGPWLSFSAFGACIPGTYGGGSALVREDTIAQKVLYFSTLDSMEHVLYNYNLLPGDTISYHVTSGTFTDTVTSMDSVLYSGYYYKIFNMQCGQWRNYTVLEGVGTTNTPILLTRFNSCIEGGESLSCFFENDTLPGLHAPIGCYSGFSCIFPYTSFDNTVCGLLSTRSLSQMPAATVTPNPSFDHIDITLSQQYENTTIAVYDLTGKCILKTQAPKNELTINTSSWNNGLYMVIIQDNTGVVKKEKVVVVK